MTNPKGMDSPQPGPEPPMYLQRPSSAKSQDVSHILARTFRDVFMKETIGSDTVHYLTKSKGSDDLYHEKYVAALEKVQKERDRRFAEAAMLERHIMQAQARAMSADERALSRASSGVTNFPDLGLPPARSHFRSCLDNEMMRKHNLITAADLITEEIYNVPAPQASPVPHYAQETKSSSHRKAEEEDDRIFTPMPLGDAVGIKSFESLSSARTEQPLPRVSKNIDKHVWRDQMDSEEREMCRNGVANLHAKVNFLKNPRHVPPSASGAKLLVISHKKKAKETGIKPELDANNTAFLEEREIFISTPSEVVFTDYKIGQVYELTLELKNVSAVLRPVRVIPPKTVYFAVGLGQFPGEHGLVAAGMSCHYTIRFSPDSLADFDDVLVIQTQSSSALKVNLKGRRPPPVLSLPEKLDVGECLIGGTKIARITVTNHGGRGRFCLVSRSSWPVTNFKTSVSSSSINLVPFEIRPTTLELQHGESTIIEVVFTPVAEETYEEAFTLICDNCQVRHFSVFGRGKTPSVEVVSMEDGLSDALPGELCDVSAHQLVRFDTLNPFTYYQKSLVVKNKVNIELRYNWQVVKPHVKPPNPDTSEAESVSTNLNVQDRELDVNSPFSVDPVEGILPACGTVDFNITFAPPMVSTFHGILHMVLKNVPAASTGSEISRPSSSNFSGSDMALPAKSTDYAMGVQDLTVLEIETKAKCEPFSVLLQPYALYIPGQVLINTQTKKTFRMINASVSSIVFEWERYCDGYIIQVEPPMGELGAQSEYDFEVTVSSPVPGKISHNLLCFVHHLDEPLTLHVEAEVKGPEMIIEESDINFGLVRLGTTVMREFRIRNLSQVSAKWSIKESRDHMDPAKLVDILLGKTENDFTFSPSEGELLPLDSMTVQAVYAPGRCLTLQTVFLLNVDGGNECAINVRGEIQTPEACLKSCVLNLSEVYLDVPVKQSITLINKTLLSTSFRWLLAEEEQAKMTQILMHPAEGQLGPREEVEIVVEFKSLLQGKIHQVKVPCEVAGMSELLYLAITCDVKGLSVAFSTPSHDTDQPGDSLKVDFGDVQIKGVPMRTLVLENKTGIAAPFSLVVENFFTKPPTPPGGRPGPQHGSTHRRTLLGRTLNLADPMTKTPTKNKADICKAMLKLNKGAAFTISPDRGTLEPFAKQIIEIQAFADMWGSYRDTIIARVEGEKVVHIPMEMNVTGCPLNFQMVAANPNQKPILRFGTHVSGTSSVFRQMRINNNSPVDVSVNWQVFTLDESDEQLLDLITCFGEPFPKCDEAGNEIVPPEEEEMDSARTLEPEPSNLPPNSEDTNPAVSQMPTQYTPEAVDQRPNVVSLFVRKHGGKQTTAPYEIGPSPTVIPAHGNGFINVKFTPPSSESVNSTMPCDGFALGYLSLDESDLEVVNQVSRQHGYLIEPMRLDMNAFVKPALLTIECAEEEGMLYRAAASDLVHRNEILDERFHTCSTILSNKTEAQLTFRLVSGEPFFLVEPDPVTELPATQLLGTDFTSLEPQQSAKVQVAFRVNRDLLEFVDLFQNEPDTQIDNVMMENIGKERKLKFKQNLVIEFNNGTCQTIPLEASLTIPSLTLSKEGLDFGTCYVGQCRQLQLLLSNPTMSDSYWAVSVESKNEACEDSTFEVSPANGKLEAFITHVSNNKSLLKVNFTARHNEVYEQVMLIHGMLGEEPIRLSLRGEGSYDGKHEVQLSP